MTTCTHLDQIRLTELPASIAGCEDCLRDRRRWVHLRMCMTCGQIGCCDSSPNRHASRARSGGGIRSRARRSPARTGAGATSTSSRSRRADETGPARRDERQPGAILTAAILGSGIAAIDGTIVNVALPAIQADLGGGLQAQQWVSNAYLLTPRLADPDRRLARRHLRRAARVRARRRRVRRVLARCARSRRRSRR